MQSPADAEGVVKLLSLSSSCLVAAIVAAIHTDGIHDKTVYSFNATLPEALPV